MAAPDLYIHVGAPKTATTALQKQVFPHLSETHYVRYLQQDLIYSDWAGCPNILWSHENLSGTPGVNMRERVDNRFTIADNLALAFPRASIILGTREPDSWLRSVYRESIRQGSPRDWESFRARSNARDRDWALYEGYLRERFPRVFVYRYEDFRRDPGQVIDSLCEFMGVVMTKPLELRVENEALSERRVRFLRAVNSLFYSESHNPDGKIPSRFARPFSRLWKRTTY